MKIKLSKSLSLAIFTTVATILTVTFMSCTTKNIADNKRDNVIIGMANPFIDFTSLKEAEDFTGFTLTLPTSIPDWVTKTIYRGSTVNMKLIEIIYAQDEKLTNEIRVRKATDTENKKDISGDYNTYEKESNIKIAGNKVRVRYNGEKIYTATWQKGRFSYSVNFSTGASEDFAKEFIAEIK